MTTAQSMAHLDAIIDATRPKRARSLGYDYQVIADLGKRMTIGVFDDVAEAQRVADAERKKKTPGVRLLRVCEDGSVFYPIRGSVYVRPRRTKKPWKIVRDVIAAWMRLDPPYSGTLRWRLERTEKEALFPGMLVR